MADDDRSMVGSICLVTGGTGRIGAGIAVALAAKGASVTVVGHQPERGAATVERIRAAAGSPRVTFALADLSSQASTRQLADGLLSSLPRLDVLVHCAGATFRTRRESADGIEMTWAVNHLGPFLLGALLCDLLRACAPCRVLQLSCAAARAAPLDPADLAARATYDERRVFAQAKLASLLCTIETSRRLAPAGVWVTAMEPCQAEAAAGAGVVGQALRRLRGGRSTATTDPKEAALACADLVTSSALSSRTGTYFVGREPGALPPATADETLVRRVWQWSAETVGIACYP